MAGNTTFAAKSTPMLPGKSSVEIETPLVAAAALAGVLKPTTVHTTIRLVVAVAVSRNIVREELA